jgi:hypothetical protein
LRRGVLGEGALCTGFSTLCGPGSEMRMCNATPDLHGTLTLIIALAFSASFGLAGVDQAGFVGRRPGTWCGGSEANAERVNENERRPNSTPLSCSTLLVGWYCLPTRLFLRRMWIGNRVVEAQSLLLSVDYCVY